MIALCSLLMSTHHLMPLPLQARTAYQSGRHQDAAAATRSAKTFNKLAILVGIIILVVVLLMQLAWIIPTAVLAALAPHDKSGED